MSNTTPYRLFLLALLLAGAFACNPFAPRLAEDTGEEALLGDQTTIEGVFANFRYSYLFRDTLIYGELLDPEFTFIYRDYENSRDVSWGRDEEMLTTFGLFRSTQNLDLVWNEVIIAVGDSLSSDVSRGFTLSVNFTAGDIIRIDGRVNLRIRRHAPDEVWKIIRWRDESNF